jgi:MFS family permease
MSDPDEGLVPMDDHEIRFTFLIWITRLIRNGLSSLIPPLIPILAVALEYPLWQLGLLVTIFSLGSGFGQAPFGYLSDKYDRRYILPTGIGTAGGSYLLFAFAPQLSGLVPTLPYNPFDSAFVLMSLSMLLCGIGTSVVHPTLYPMISENVQDTNKGKVMGIFGSAAKAGDATTPILVGVLILALVWSEIILIVGLFGIAFSIVLFVVLRGFETEPAEAHTPPEADDTETVWESDNREYVYPMVVIYLFFITRGFAGRGIKTFIPAFIVGVYGYTMDLAGISLAAESIANFYFSSLLVVGATTQILVGWFVDSSDARKVLIVCMSTATASILALAYLELSPAWLLLVLLLVGIGIWGLNPARDMLISEVTPAEREGRTFGYLWTAAHLTSAIIPTLVGYIADTFGLRQSFGVLAIGSFLAAVSILLLYSDRVYVTTDRERPDQYQSANS